MLGYKEELEVNIISDITEGKISDRKDVTLLNEFVKKYIPSLEEIDIGKFGIIEGKLYYVGDDELGKKAAESQMLAVIPEGKTLEDFMKDVQDAAIDAVVKSLVGKSFTTTDEDGNTVEVGVKLLNKNMQNAQWKIINEVSEGKNVATYGTGWTYVEEGTEIDGLGKLAQGYIINFDEKKAVRFDGNKHSMLSWDSALAVPDGLIFAVDPAIIESGFSGDKKWAEGLDVYGYAHDYSDTFTKTSMKFDGENDYVVVPGSAGNICQKGFSYEFYGKPKGLGKWLNDITDQLPEYDNNVENVPILRPDTYLKTEKSDDGRTYQMYSNLCPGILSYGTKKFGEATLIKFLFRTDSRTEELKDGQIANLYFNYGCGGNLKGGSTMTFFNEVLDREIRTGETITPWSCYHWAGDGTDYWNQCFNFSSHGCEMFFGTDLYYSIVINPESDTQAVYINGELSEEVQLNTNAWRQLESVLESKEENGMWFVGKATEGQPFWNMFEGDIYTLRIYERPLTDKEIKANYNATISYHNFMLNGGDAVTSGNLGGEDF